MESKPPFQKIARLILLSLYGKAEKSQTDELQAWLKEYNDNTYFYKKILSHSYLEKGLQEYMQYDSRNAWKQMRRKIQTPQKSFIKRFLPYAAAIAILTGIIMLTQVKNPMEPPILKVAKTTPIFPGSSRAQLILSDGQQINLEAESNRLCRTIEGENFLNDGTSLDYSQQHLAPDAIRFHTLRIPRGGEYRIVLSDGTRIWMNADSELTYPDYFSENQRKVTLRGEAYFEVTPDTRRPFYVEIEDMTVKVLGTSFNVSAYPDEKRRITLVEGCVTVSRQQQEVVIRPGQQAVESNEGLQVKKVNVINHIGWKNQRFIYEDQDLGEVLKELERWYDVSIIIADKNIGKLHLTANLPKYETIDKVLNIIKYAACVEFDIKGRNIVVRRY